MVTSPRGPGNIQMRHNQTIKFYTLQRIGMLLTTIVVSASLAQDDKRPVGIDFTRAECETLVAGLDPEVLRELKIPQDQWQALLRRVSPSVSTHETQWLLLDARRAKKARLIEALTPAQRVRLEELTLQWEGALCAFLRPTIAAKLKLTPEQNRRLETIFELYSVGLPNAGLYTEHYRSNDGIDQLKLNKAADTIAESMLTVTQRLQWEQMQGPRLTPEPQYWRMAQP